MDLVTAWRSNLKFRLGVIILALIILLALVEPLVKYYYIGDRDTMTTGNYRIYMPFSAEHPLGTDRMGRDTLSMILLGLRYSLIIGAVAGSIASAVGIVVGFVAGYKGGVVDTVLRSTTDMILVIPTYPILVTLSAWAKSLDVLTMALILAAFSWPWAARTIRAQVMSLRERPYIDLAKLSGQSDAKIIFQEILPNLLPFLGVGYASATVGAILAEVGLELLGLGPSGISTLGLIINWAIGWGVMTLGQWQLLVIPAGLLLLIFFAINVINIGLDESFNPRLKRVTGM